MTAVPEADKPPWFITSHARQQAAERGIALDEIYAVLDQPQIRKTTVHDDHVHNPHVFEYMGHGICLAVNEFERSVITVMLQGSSKEDWESDALTRKSTLPWASSESSVVVIRPVPAAMPTGKRNNRPKPVFWTRREADPLSHLHPAVREGVETELAKRNLSVADIRVLSPTKVEFLR